VAGPAEPREHQLERWWCFKATLLLFGLAFPLAAASRAARDLSFISLAAARFPLRRSLLRVIGPLLSVSTSLPPEE